ncbi:MAG: leucine-rich repeat domain-containing protein [Ruminococcaceae bacterium]|nr:leucine-rich repeat domain-containing protein [Oscillospiraceae bacterium]
MVLLSYAVSSLFASFLGGLYPFQGDSVTAVGDSAFQQCLKLTAFKGEKLTTIGASAFADCITLAEIDLSHVTSIGNEAFSACAATVAEEDVTPDVTLTDPNFISLGTTVFNGSQLRNLTLGAAALSEIGGGFGQSIRIYGTLTITGNGTDSAIASGAFFGCQLNGPAVISGVKTIGDGAFSACTVSAVTLSDVVTIGSSAFACQMLSSLILPPSVESVSGGAFSYMGANLEESHSGVVYYYGGTSYTNIGTWFSESGSVQPYRLLTVADGITNGKVTASGAMTPDALAAKNYFLPGDTVTLLADVTTESAIYVGNEKNARTVTLDLNGHSLLMTGNDCVIQINSNSKLTLKDSAATNKPVHKITLDENGRAAAVETVDKEGKDSATVKYVAGGGNCGVYVRGTFEMTGGTIIGNIAEYSGGGVYVANSGTFKVSGGATVAGNTKGTRRTTCICPTTARSPSPAS